MFINRGNLDIDTHIDRMPCEHESRDWGGTSVSQEMLEFSRKPAEARGEACNYLGLWASKTVGQYISVV